MNIVVGAARFQSSLMCDIEAARASIEVQTTALEGDSAGRVLAQALSAATHVRRRRVIVGCVRPQRPLLNAMLAELRAAGVLVRFGHPAGLLGHRSLARNHKQSIVIDDRVSYFGGFAFTDPDFAAHDLMVRCSDARVADALASDMRASWRGRHHAITAAAPGIEIMTTDGRANSLAFDRIFSRIALARAAIVVYGPYLSLPFFEHLRRAAGRGVRVVVITSSDHTMDNVRSYISRDVQRACFELHLTPGTSHLKALLIDDGCLIAGSSSFDYLSVRLHQEVIALITDAAAIAEFRARVLEPDLRACIAPRHGATSFAGPLVSAG